MNLDISIVFVVLMVSIILTLMGYMIREKETDRLFLLFSSIWGMLSLGYILKSGYDTIMIGTFTFPMFLFLIAFLFLGILIPLVLLFNRVI